MKFVQGEDLGKLSFEGAYPDSVTCNCGSVAFLLGVVDDEVGDELCHLPKPEGARVWPHDSCSIAIYLCGNCLTPLGKFTQG